MYSKMDTNLIYFLGNTSQLQAELGFGEGWQLSPTVRAETAAVGYLLQCSENLELFQMYSFVFYFLLSVHYLCNVCQYEIHSIFKVSAHKTIFLSRARG